VLGQSGHIPSTPRVADEGETDAGNAVAVAPSFQLTRHARLGNGHHWPLRYLDVRDIGHLPRIRHSPPDAFVTRGIRRNPSSTHMNQERASAMSKRAFREIAFIDPAISHLDSFVAGLRPGIEMVLLSREGHAVSEIAAALEGRAGLDAIHIVAHGAPGELRFGTGPLNIKTINDHRAELAEIGDALSRDGTLLLWSCETGAGWQGACFVEALERATGAEIAAAQGKIGAAV